MADEFSGRVRAQWTAETQRRGPKLPVSWKVFFRQGPTPWPNMQSAPKMRGGRCGLKGDQIAAIVLETVSGRDRALLGSSGYNTKCLYEALWLLETVRDGALLLGEERRFVFIGCLECVEDCGHLLY